ncbi:hypothetical protein R5R35_003683 [Gryllus longicercus]|uniref:cAMP-dependent protein kinase n=1 Tax=Gryllus longicercus TaxID=2509291 RepID=A0AAN9V5U4_9ORTH
MGEIAESSDVFPPITDLKSFLDKSKGEFEQRYHIKASADITLASFDKIRALGAGSFGTVVLVKYKKTGHFYAIKVMEKAKVMKLKQVDHTLNEKRILQAIRFPFVVWMDFCFKDNANIYFAMPFICGGEMFNHLRKMGKFDENLSKFYGAQVVLALEYLHYLDVLYRDLKPENIMIDKTGYLKVTDMGFCKIVKGRTWTLCGTPEYIAPEILLSKGYGPAVDWWSFGVLIYEMSAGHPPFYSRDPMKIYEKIVACKYHFATHFSYELKDLIYNILQVDLTRRYGNLKNGVEDIRRHKWFKYIDWLAIVNRKVKPPFVPKVKSAGDTSNFDPFDEKPLPVSNKNLYEQEFKDF